MILLDQNKIDVLKWGIDYARTMGINDCEIYGLAHNSNSIEVKDNKLDGFKQSNIMGYGVRLFSNMSLGFAFGSHFTKSGVKEVIDNSIAASKFLLPDESNMVTPFSNDYVQMELYSKDIANLSIEKKKDIVFTMEKVAKDNDKISQVIRSAYSDSNYQIALVNSNGLDLSYYGNYCSGSISLVASDGVEDANGSDYYIGRDLKLLSPTMIAKTAVCDGIGKLGGKPVPTGNYDIVFDSSAVTDIIGLLAPSVKGDNVYKGQSRFSDMLGSVVASHDFNLYDDSLLAGGIGSSPFDDEGTPTSKTEIIRNGILTNFLQDNYSAKKNNMTSTGNAGRTGYSGLPYVSMSNYYLDKGVLDKNDVIKSVQKGIYVKDLMGLHMANSITGEFSLGIEGFLIENGELSRPVRSSMMVGNVFDLIKNVSAICNDLKFYSSIGAPTIKVDNMTISGK